VIQPGLPGGDPLWGTFPNQRMPQQAAFIFYFRAFLQASLLQAQK